MKTCKICGWIWDPNPWRKCPRCAARTKAYEPSLDEIRTACEAIQATWSPADKHKRCTANPVPAEIHVATLVHYREDD